MSALLGCIADDFTGATDLASMLVRAGMRTVQTIGVPEDARVAAGADAVVVALKSRTIPAAEAVSQSLAALAWLRSAGARQIYFKYCSTFDSTPAGNIGPVGDALLDALGADFTIACPAFPENGRTIYKGHLFVGDLLLSDSPMKDHPLTPMRDSSLVRVLAGQTKRAVGLVEHKTVRRGANAIRARFDELRAKGTVYAVVDALADEDLMAIGAACAGLALVTAGSGVALGLPQNFFAAGLMQPRTDAAAASGRRGKPAVLAGSCSAATRQQVAQMAARHPAHALDPIAEHDAARLAAKALSAIAPALEAREAVPRLLDRRAVAGRCSAGKARGGARSSPHRGRARDRRGADRRERRAAHGGRRRRNFRCSGEGAGREGARDRPADRSRRAVDDERRQRAAHRARAQERQLRHAGLLREGAGAVVMMQRLTWGSTGLPPCTRAS